jgi:hypothetical protein
MQVYKDLLQNAIANAETKNLDPEKLVITHAQVNRAPPGRRRTYRAHGRIGKYASQPAHIKLILTEKPEGVEKADDCQENGGQATFCQGGRGLRRSILSKIERVLQV